MNDRLTTLKAAMAAQEALLYDLANMLVVTDAGTFFASKATQVSSSVFTVSLYTTEDEGYVKLELSVELAEDTVSVILDSTSLVGTIEMVIATLNQIKNVITDIFSR